MVTLATLEAERLRDQQRPDAGLRGAGVSDARNFTADYAARIFRRVVWQQAGIAVDLGFVGPLQRTAFGGNNTDLSYMVLGGGPIDDDDDDDDGQGGEDQAGGAATTATPQPVCRVWIWNNNEPGAGHYEGIRDA